MSDPTAPVDPNGGTAAAQSATNANAAATAAAAPSASATAAAAEGDVKSFNSLADMREKAPKVYKAMMMGIAMNVVHDMERHQDELKKLQKEYERE